MQITVYSLGVVCRVQFIVCSLQFVECSVQCAVCSVQCVVCSVQCEVCSLQYVECKVHSKTVGSVHWTVQCGNIVWYVPYHSVPCD